MKKVKFIQQMEFSECGLACVAMILNYHDYQITLNEIRDEFPSPRGGYSFLNLTQIADNKKMMSRAVQIDESGVENLILPAILHWEGNHFVILEKIRNDIFHIVDPAKGRMRLKKIDFITKMSGFAIMFSPSSTFQKRSIEESNILFHYFSKHKKTVFHLLALTILLQIVLLTIPLVTKWTTDHLLINKEEPLMNVVGITILGIFITYLFFTGVRSFILAKAETSIDKSIMTDFMNTLVRLPHSFFDNRSNGDILFRANSNFYIRDILSTTFISIIIDAMLIITYFFILMTFSKILAVILLLLSIILMTSLFFNSKIVRKLVDTSIRDKVKVQSQVTEIVHNAMDIKVLGIEEELLGKWSINYDTQLKSSQRLNIWEGIVYTITSGIQVMIPLLILWMGTMLYLRGDITVGTVIASSSIAVSFISPIISMSNHYTQIVSLRAYFTRLVDVIKTKKEQETNPGLVYEELKMGKIEFKNVSFSHNQFVENTIKDISFTIKPGETVAIVGPSGSGKSTIAKLLLGLHRVTKGEILIDDVAIEKYHLPTLRKQIGSVLQEAELFNGTFKENIGMGADVEEREIEEAAQMAMIYDDIIKTPLKFETIISEGGGNLSGGQRQRLIIARALLKKPKLIVFDEATSSLDNITEHLIKENIENLKVGKLIIAHRLNTVQSADKIVVLHEGRIVESGTHSELINNRQRYYRLYLKMGESEHDEKSNHSVSLSR